MYRNLLTILASYLFYGWWDWRFLSLIVISSTVDYTIGLSLAKNNNASQRKVLLYISVLVNLGMLGFFKYFNFFIDSFQSLFRAFHVDLDLQVLEILLPVGISFYTFQTLSYTIDVYRRELAPTKDPFSFFAFVAFFPQLVAGPIERASRLLSQFSERKTFSYPQAVGGMRLILWGFFKKVVIADNCGVLADAFLLPATDTSGAMTLIGTFFFALQIYADFLGYSDMAIGISRMLGVNLMKNFKTPYFADSLQNFWQRWHISLSTWFRDYVYIPLGGNQGNMYRVSFNIFLTFLLSGWWHGAKFTFIIWGALHGGLLIFEKYWIKKLPAFFAPIFLFVLVSLLWIPFRAESISHLFDLVISIFSFETYAMDAVTAILLDFSVLRFSMLSLVLFLFFILEYRLGILDFNEWISKRQKVFRISSYYIMVTIILLLGNFSVKPQFIYFQF